MTNEVAKQEQQHLDGFETYTDEVEGEEDQSPSNRVIQGVRLKFTNEATWIDDIDEELPAGLELIAIDVGRVVQKWVNQLPTETIVLGPGERFPDINKLNAECPKNEWREGLGGQMQGPWQAQHVVYLLDPKTMTRYSWPTSTIGGAICVRDLVDRVKWMRKSRARTSTPLLNSPTRS